MALALGLRTAVEDYPAIFVELDARGFDGLRTSVFEKGGNAEPAYLLVFL